MLNRVPVATLLMFGVTAWFAGCNNSVTGGAELASLVDAKATDVAERIGGSDGFGGTGMEGYLTHAQGGIRFVDADDLADASSSMMITIENDSPQDCTVHFAYIASHLGLTEQTQNVEIAAGDEVSIEVPCAEIMGMGSVEVPGATACHLADGEAIDNMMSVPGFLSLDYACGDSYRFMLAPDTEDRDGDGDTSELLMSSDALQMHMSSGGPMGHQHGDGSGMMGSEREP